MGIESFGDVFRTLPNVHDRNFSENSYFLDGRNTSLYNFQQMGASWLHYQAATYYSSLNLYNFQFFVFGYLTGKKQKIFSSDSLWLP